MSQPVSSNQKWKISTVFFATMFIVFIGISVYALAQNNSLNNDKTNLQNNYNNLKATDDANVQKISQLNTNIASLDSQISTLQAQQTADQSMITHLQAELLANYTQLQKLESVNLVVVIQWQSTKPTMFGCGFLFLEPCPGTATVTDVAWANLGTTTATNAIATAYFYTTPDATGSPICHVSGPLGKGGLGIVQGQTIDLQTDISANNSCTTGSQTALSASVSVTWT